jgi:hypothetical protein
MKVVKSCLLSDPRNVEGHSLLKATSITEGLNALEWCMTCSPQHLTQVYQCLIEGKCDKNDTNNHKNAMIMMSKTVSSMETEEDHLKRQTYFEWLIPKLLETTHEASLEAILPTLIIEVSR